MNQRFSQYNLIASEYEKLGGNRSGDVNIGTFNTTYETYMQKNADGRLPSIRDLEKAIKRKNGDSCNKRAKHN